ncbi:hypothetical protein OBA45_01210 [bacterium]|nr:hypothetical protein [bacterium]
MLEAKPIKKKIYKILILASSILTLLGIIILLSIWFLSVYKADFTPHNSNSKEVADPGIMILRNHVTNALEVIATISLQGKKQETVLARLTPGGIFLEEYGLDFTKIDNQKYEINGEITDLPFPLGRTTLSGIVHFMHADNIIKLQFSGDVSMHTFSEKYLKSAGLDTRLVINFIENGANDAAVITVYATSPHLSSLSPTGRKVLIRALEHLGETYLIRLFQ